MILGDGLGVVADDSVMVMMIRVSARPPGRHSPGIRRGLGCCLDE